MALSEKESNKIKEHLIKQLSNFPEEKRNEIKNQINAMSTEDVENFIKQNQLNHLGNQCILCSIISKQTKSFEIGEDDKSLAVLEINPLSKGHSLIIPKKHSDTLSTSPKRLARIISEKIIERFSPKKITTNEIKITNHSVLEIIPIYGNETKRSPASEKELSTIKEELSKSPQEIKIEKASSPIEKEVKKPLHKLKPRIP